MMVSSLGGGMEVIGTGALFASCKWFFLGFFCFCFFPLPSFLPCPGSKKKGRSEKVGGVKKKTVLRAKGEKEAFFWTIQCVVFWFLRKVLHP